MLYESIEHRAELKLSHHLPNWTMSALFPGLFFSFLSLIESEISKQGSRQVATEQLNKGLDMLGAVIDVIITLAEQSTVKASLFVINA